MELQSPTRESWNRTWDTIGAIAYKGLAYYVSALIDDDDIITRITSWRVTLPH